MKLVGNLLVALAASGLAGCGQSDRETAERIEVLQAQHGELNKRFEKAAASEPLVTSAVEARGQIALAIRSGLIEELAGSVASRYLDRVTVDLGDVKAQGSGKLDKQTFLGKVKLGDWAVSVDLGTMVGHLRAAPPIVSLRPPDLIEIELPVDVEEGVGDARLHFEWDSAGVTNVVCNDFKTTIDIKGRVLPQRHILKGALRLANAGGRLTETPLFPDRRIQVRMDLTKESWAAVEAALRSEDTTSKCGMLANAEDGMTFLRALAAKGIGVNLPDSIFRTVDLPARLQESVRVNQRAIGLRVTAESLRIETATLWSSARVQVEAQGQRQVQVQAPPKP